MIKNHPTKAHSSVMRHARIICFLIILLTASGCDSIFESHEIVGTWEIAEAVIGPSTIWPESIVITSDDLAYPAWLSLNRRGVIGGRTCNSYSGRYTILTGEQLAVQDWLGTQVRCHGGSPDDAVDQAFGGLSTYSPADLEIVDHVLIITYEGVRLEFQRAD